MWAWRTEDRSTRIGLCFCAAINLAGIAYVIAFDDPCAWQGCDFGDDTPDYFIE